MRVVRAEWTKLWTLPSTGWLLAGVAFGTAGLSSLVTWATPARRCLPNGFGCGPVDVTRLSLAGTYLGQVMVLLLAALAVTNEYGSRMVTVSLAATPRRTRLVAARVSVLSGLIMAASAAGVAGSLLAGRVFLHRRGYGALSLADGSTQRAAYGTVMYLGLIALLAMGVALLIRDTAGTLTTLMCLLFIPPLAAALMTNQTWRDWTLKLSPGTAGMAIQTTLGLDDLPIRPWPGLGVLAVEAVGLLLVGWASFWCRDA